MGNDHGFDHWDHLEFRSSETTGGTHRPDGGGQLSDYQLQHTDWVTVSIHYPNGHVETRTFVGPFNDMEDLEYDIQEWWDSEGGS